MDVEFACTVIAACVIFHNICELNHERYDKEWTENEPNNVNEDQTIGDELNELYVNELLCAKSMRDDLAVAMSSGNIWTCPCGLRIIVLDVRYFQMSVNLSFDWTRLFLCILFSQR